MIRKGIVLVLVVSTLVLLALILHIRLTQSRNADFFVKLPTDGVWIGETRTTVFVAWLLDDRLRLEFYHSLDPNAVAKWVPPFRDAQVHLAHLDVGEERLVTFIGPPFVASGLRSGGRGVMFPLWAPCLLLAVYPAIAFIRGPYRRHRRRKKGLCLTCSYNLADNIGGARLECGERIGPDNPIDHTPDD